MVEQYDVIVIGAGQSGGPLAGAFAGAGRKTALIEATHVGGTCINEGCTPTKTMVASARAAYLARRGADYGVQTGAISVDMNVVRQRKRDIVASWRSGSEASLQKAGVELIMAEGSFSGPHTVQARLNDGGTRELQAPQIFINAGARPALPALPGLDNVPYLDSTSIMELATVPEHLLVLGGGYIGLEFGQMFRRFGSQVTIVQRGAQLLTREDADIATAVAEILRDDGIEVLLEHGAHSVTHSPGQGFEMTVSAAQGERVLRGTQLLVATGRRPNSDRLNLAATGIASDKRGNILVNERLETSIEGIYALGDITGGAAFTHTSYDDYRIINTNLLGQGGASTNGRLVPYTVFIDPQLGRVGMSEEQAREQGRKIRVARLPMSSVARAIEVDETRGLMKAIIDADSDQILGFAMLGIEGGEIMGAVQIAMMGKLPFTALRDGMFAHPTLIESLNNLFATA